MSKPRIEDVFQNGLPVLKGPEIVEDDKEREALTVSTSNHIKERVEYIKSMLGSMEDGEISISAYDTAWVALVEDIHGSGLPQFPSTLQWIAKNQLPDGSWGDSQIFYSYDRIINTLACVIALKSWNIHPEKYEKGISFLKEKICKLEYENAEQMTIGFEVAFPSLLEIARSLNIEVADDSPVLQEIYAKRNIKLTRIPRDMMHKVPTTLLYSLEGMPGLEWEKLLNLQFQDGSFLFSPSSTAFALMQTKDDNCLTYLKNAVHRFNGGGYALEVPWYASLPRVETRFYIEQYGGDDDVWIGKTLYRMPYVSNKTYLELAKLDYNNCQASHRMEWESIQKWYSDCNLGDFGLSRKTLLFAYFLAVASIFEPERSNERLAWVKTTALVEAITSYFVEEEMRRAFLHEFRNNADPRDCINRRFHIYIYILLDSINLEFFDNIK
ncbi:(-)-kolavenyl diphosphate synthase TPS28, chloroplastic-like [Corylus avellana]|uniref:(-)-kolavenyl diphosphate synthase TPS28, chloroplastic-like n=1 Tax=Corylus avellana TaxID=13451 RepID=UPI00286CC0EF|nr:(-)-kolavenyl diphosphate synthase TPS28, chloroplastic-like [Corylus avellana]